MALIFIVNHHPHGALKSDFQIPPIDQSIPGVDSFRYAVTEILRMGKRLGNFEIEHSPGDIFEVGYASEHPTT